MIKRFGTLVSVDESDLELLKNNPEEFWRDVEKIDRSAFVHHPHGSFDNDNPIEEIVIPDGVIEIGSGAFAGCKSLKRVVLGKDINKIDFHAFEGCDGLEEICFDEDIRNLEIGVHAFTECTALKKLVFPKNCYLSLQTSAFEGCTNLEEVVLPVEVSSKIEKTCFFRCGRLSEIEIHECSQIEENAIPATIDRITFKSNGKFGTWIPNDFLFCPSETNGNPLNFLYFSKDGKKLVLTKEKDEKLEKEYFAEKYSFLRATMILWAPFYAENYAHAKRLREEYGKKFFIPPDYILGLFPADIFRNYYINDNCGIWRDKIIKPSGFLGLSREEKQDALVGLFKIYYAIGGFSPKQEERNAACEYVREYIIKNRSTEELAKLVHEKFDGFEIKTEYNPTFAKFFMRYFKHNPDFMTLTPEELGEPITIFNGNEPHDYLRSAHNNFGIILSHTNRTTEGNTENDLLTPVFVAKCSRMKEYSGVLPGNELLAEYVGWYGYTQDEFEKMQEIFEKAKPIKDQAIIKADNSVCKDSTIQFRVLEKDDPLGFILGDITNCCQRFGCAAESCVVDGYVSTTSGFMVFEEKIDYENGKSSTRVIGQAFVWYDESTKTICYDNIEVPKVILEELKRGDKNNEQLSLEKFIEIVETSAKSVIETMRANGVEVEKVTTGTGYNDLRSALAQRFEMIDPIARNANPFVYSDAKESQILLKTYDEVTKMYAGEVRDCAQEIEEDLNEVLRLSFGVENEGGANK